MGILLRWHRKSGVIFQKARKHFSFVVYEFSPPSLQEMAFETCFVFFATSFATPIKTN